MAQSFQSTACIQPVQLVFAWLQMQSNPCRALLRFGSIHDKKNYVTLSNVIHYRLCTKKLNVHLKLNECKQTFLWSSIRYQLESIITVEQSYNSPFFKDDAIDLPDNDVAILKKYAKQQLLLGMQPIRDDLSISHWLRSQQQLLFWALFNMAVALSE